MNRVPLLGGRADVDARWQLGRRTAPRVIVALVAALAAAHGGTQLLDRGPATSATGPSVRHVAVDGMRLTVSRAWTPVTGPPAVKGIDTRSGLSLDAPGTGVRVTAALLPYTRPDLLPSALAPAGAPPPAGTPVRLNRRFEAYRFAGLSVPGRRGLVDVYATPTSRGIATVACYARDLIAWMQSQCRAISDTLVIVGASPLRATPDAPFSARLPEALRTLDAARARARRELAAAADGAAQAEAMDRLARVYARSARWLGAVLPETPETAAEVVDALAALDDAFATVAAALRIADPSALATARTRVRAAERRLDRLAGAYPGDGR